MSEDQLAKGTSGAGTSAIRNFKDLFPNQISTLYVYKGVNLVSKGNEVFAREDDLSIIALEALGSVDAIFGGEVFAVTPNTIEEEKTIKEIELEKFSTAQLTALMEDVEIDLTQPNLFYTIDEPFVQGDINEKRLDIFVDQQLIPGTLKKLLSGVTRLTEKQKKIASGDTVTFTLVPADTQNNMPSSKISFVDATIYKPLPIDSDEFEITSIDVESDQTLALEYTNGFKARGVIEDKFGKQTEVDLDFKMDKPLMPLQITPYDKNSNVQFAIDNFNYYQRMPFLSAEHFLGADRSITSFIVGDGKDGGATELAQAVLDMFIMSWAISTGYEAYDTDKDSIGGVSLKAMVGKDPDKLYSYVDQILRNWEYKNNVKNKKTEAYKRALQVLAASSEVVQSSYCVGKGLTEFHKTIFDFWLNLDTLVTKETKEIFMTLSSSKYVFTYEKDKNGNPDLSKPIINLSPILTISKNTVTNFGRLTSVAELDDPISVAAFSNFAGDIDPTRADATKYFIGVDITEQDKISSFLGNMEPDDIKTITVNKEYETPWYGKEVWIGGGSHIQQNWGIAGGNQYEGIAIAEHGSVKRSSLDDVLDNGSDEIILTVDERNKLIEGSIAVPAGATNVQIDYSNVSELTATTTTARTYSNYFTTGASAGGSDPLHGRRLKTAVKRFVGAVVTYDIEVPSHGVSDRKQTYDKGEFLKLILGSSTAEDWKRNMVLDDNWRDKNGNQIQKIKSIDHIFISMFLGNYVDIKLNYKYKGTDGKTNTGTTILPRIELPSATDETRTKIGIRL